MDSRDFLNFPDGGPGIVVKIRIAFWYMYSMLINFMVIVWRNILYNLPQSMLVFTDGNFINDDDNFVLCNARINEKTDVTLRILAYLKYNEIHTVDDLQWLFGKNKILIRTMKGKSAILTSIDLTTGKNISTDETYDFGVITFDE